MPEIPPADKEVGDPGHTDDHNLITLALVNHQDRLVVIEADVAEMLTADEGFTVEINNSDHFHFAYLELPAGSRSDQPDIFGVYQSGNGILRVDGDGRLLLRSFATGHNPLSVRGHTSQTANLTEWRNGSNTLVAWIDSSGNIHAPNLTPSATTNVTLSGGISWAGNPSPALRPRYWTLGETTEMRGAVTPTAGSFSFSSGPVQLGSIPSAAGPPYGHMDVQATGGSASGVGWIRVQVEAPSLGACRIMAHAPSDFNPNTIYLDGLRFNRSTGS